MIVTPPGSGFDCGTSAPDWCHRSFLTILLILALPSAHFDCCTPLLKFCLSGRILIVAFPGSILIAILPGSNFILTVPVNTAVWQSLTILLIVALPDSVLV